MIPITRNRTESKINKKFRGEGKKAQDLVLLTDQRSILNALIENHSFKSTYWKTSKSQLKAESYNKCAYCEADTSVVAHGDVEHFRPKSEYWWLAYTYDNYLYSCQICNQTYKSSNFPVAGSKLTGPAVLADMDDATLNTLAGMISPDPFDINNGFTIAQFTQLHSQEQSLILNPYFDNPVNYFGWGFDDVKKEVTLVPVNDNPFTKNVVDACIEYYGLNRIELRDLRYNEFDKYRVFRRVIEEQAGTAALRADVQRQINKMKSDQAMFSGMIRYFDSLPYADLS
jgi:hypothetical protein